MDSKTSNQHTDHVIKIVLVGDVSTGKTSLLERYIDNKFCIKMDHTVAVDFRSTKITCGSTKYKLYFWDTAGDERYGPLKESYYKNAVGSLVVYDITNKKSLDNCQKWKKEIDDNVRLINGNRIPTILIANKYDSDRDPKEKCYDGEQFSRDHDFGGYFKTSAKDGVGINDAINVLVKKVLEQAPVHVEATRTTTVNRSTIGGKTSNGFKRPCCLCCCYCRTK